MLTKIATFPLFLCCLVVFTVSSCRNRTSAESEVKHKEGDIVNSLPGFMWTKVPDDVLPRFINSQLDSKTTRVPQDSKLTKHLQAMLDRLDEKARELRPNEMKKVPSPVAVVLKSEEVNAYVMARHVCVKQWMRKGSALHVDPATLPPPPPLGAGVIDLSYPGQIYESTLSPTPADTSPDATDNSSHCNIMEPDAIGFDATEFVQIHNAKLTEDKQQCKLEFVAPFIVYPDNQDCGYTVSSYIGVAKFDAQANVVFFYSGLLAAMSEGAVASVAAHELAHIYQAHAAYQTSFSPYFFNQNEANELQRPEKSNDHEDVQKAMLDGSNLYTIKRGDGVKLDANLFHIMMDLDWKFFMNYCAVGTTCQAPYNDFKTIKASNAFDEVWSHIGYKPLTGEVLKTYLNFEDSFFKLLSAIQIPSLTDAEKIQIQETVPVHMKKYFEDLNSQNSFAKWFEDADKKIVEVIPGLRTVFEKGASVGLGFYTTEEEADEVGIELAARTGVSAEQESQLWIDFMATKKAQGFEAGILETSYEECDVMRKNGWKTDGADVYPKLLIDSLANIHHGMCYRLFNTEREWNAHKMDKLKPASGAIAFNEAAWPAVVAEVHSPSTNALTFTGSNRLSETRPIRPSCVFAPRGLGIGQD